MVNFKRQLLLSGMMLLLAAALAGGALAKAEVELAEIDGPGLESSIQVHDPDTLSLLNPWTAEFADWRDGLVEANPSLETAYQVLLFISVKDGRQNLEPIYLFYYLPNLGSDRGLVYVPGPGEEWYTRNVATIIAGREGEWHPASEALDAALRPLIESRAVREGARPLAGLSGVAVISLALLLASSLIAALLGRRVEVAAPPA